MRVADRVFAVFLLALAAVYLYATLQLPSLSLSDPVGPKAFPVLLAIACVLAALLLLAETVRRPPGLEDGEEATAERRAGQSKQMVAIVAVTGWLLLYYVVLEPVGYLISTTVFLLGLLAYFHPGRALVNVMVSIGFALGAYAFFTQLLTVRLPTGLLSF